MTSGSRPDAYADLHLAGVPEINTLPARGADPGGRAGASPPDPPGYLNRIEGGLAFEGFVQIVIDLFEIAHRGEPFLIGADQEGEVLGHPAIFHSVDADLFEGLGKAQKG